ncbi:sensor histidine kinase [Ekhidna sp. MALMAid0563]|uniref:sensor histidine kinase n=1 Tax=Ekhidna sp. MALMAid0563 TaxID=3143937 RepID=UPI0032DECB51
MQQLIELMEIGAIATFAAYNLVLYRQVKKSYYLYLGLLSFSIFMRATLVDDGSMIFFTFFPDVSLEMGRKIEYFSSYMGAPLSVLFCYTLYPLPAIKRYVNGFLILCGLLLLFVLVTPYSLYYHSLTANSILVLLSYVIMYTLLIKAVKEKRVGSWYVLAGTLLCFLFVMAELSKILGIWEMEGGPNLVNSGFVIFIFFQSIALSEIFAHSFKENEELNKNLEKRVEEKTAEITRASLLRDTLIRIISHDIRGPMSNLKSVISLVQEDQVGVDQVKEFMGTIDKSVDHTIQMLDELMEWGHAASQNKRIEQEEIDLREIIESIVQNMSRHIEEKKLDVKLSGDLDAACLFDKGALKIVIRNLISNAVKFTEKGGHVNVVVNKNDRNISIEIQDNGIGIPDEMKANLFEMKKDNKRRGTDNEKSSGVGLFICKDLITQNGGDISVADNPEGKGTIFKFELKSAS